MAGERHTIGYSTIALIVRTHSPRQRWRGVFRSMRGVIMLEKILRYGIKIAAVMLTAPATIEVAGSLYPDQLVWRLMVQAGGLVLVEGALLLGWHMLDTETKATSGQRGLYAVLAGVAYFVLWVIAWFHGEGVVGIAFRATLGVLLGYSVFESGLLANISFKRQVERDITKHWRVKGHRQKAEVKIAKLEVNNWEALEVKRLTLELERGQKSLESQHIEALAVTVDQRSDLSTPKRNDIEAINTRRKVSREKRLELFGKYIAGHSEMPASALVEWLMVRFGVAESTAWRDYSELRPEAPTSPVNGSNGHNGHK